jgi:hypothetical protein
MGKKSSKGARKSGKGTREKPEITKGKRQRELVAVSPLHEAETKSEAMEIGEDPFVWLRSCKCASSVHLIDVDKIEIKTEENLFDSLLL